MDIPIRFPNNADVIAEDAARFRALSPEEQLKTIHELIKSGEFLMRNSNRQASLKQLAAIRMMEKHRAIREFVARHAT